MHLLVPNFTIHSRTSIKQSTNRQRLLCSLSELYMQTKKPSTGYCTQYHPVRTSIGDNPPIATLDNPFSFFFFLLSLSSPTEAKPAFSELQPI